MTEPSDFQNTTKMLKVLYVEDDLSAREKIGDILKLFFNNITIAKDGLEAWKVFQQENFDLIITDINMPNMNGIELIKKIKSINQNQKTVITTAYNCAEYLLSAIEIGVDNFILKPIQIEQLESVINKISSSIHKENIDKFYQLKLENEIKTITKELIHQSITDELTGLYNRSKLQMFLLEQKDRVLMLLNIDNFDNINATYGYEDGDIILKKIAHFFKNNIHDDAILFRLSHDEFAFLFRTINIKQATNYAHKLQNLILLKPIIHKDMIVKYTATIVLASGEKDLLKRVHLAFKETRAIGKNRIGVYHHNSGLEERQKMLRKSMHILSEVLENDMVTPYFQAIVNNKTKEIEKYECLARIIHNDKVLTPDFFIETAKLSGLLPDITRSMIIKSFKYFKKRTENFSINISEEDLNNNYLYEFLQENIDKHSIKPSRVVLEVLEGVSTSGAEKNFNQLIALKELGFKLAIDDFGAQNSNFERVHKLKVDYIKIDGSFIKNIDTDTMSYQVAKTITNFSKSIGAKVVAEYVHNESVQNKIIELDIDYSQGYYFSKPLDKIKKKIS